MNLHIASKVQKYCLVQIDFDALHVAYDSMSSTTTSQKYSYKYNMREDYNFLGDMTNVRTNRS